MRYHMNKEFIVSVISLIFMFFHIDVKTFYINKHGKGWPIAKKYYVCKRPNEKVWPVSEKEARQVKTGDKIKVLIISADVFGYSVCYGKADNKMNLPLQQTRC